MDFVAGLKEKNLPFFFLMLILPLRFIFLMIFGNIFCLMSTQQIVFVNIPSSRKENPENRNPFICTEIDFYATFFFLNGFVNLFDQRGLDIPP